MPANTNNAVPLYVVPQFDNAEMTALLRRIQDALDGLAVGTVFGTQIANGMQAPITQAATQTGVQAGNALSTGVNNSVTTAAPGIGGSLATGMGGKLLAGLAALGIGAFLKGVFDGAMETVSSNVKLDAQLGLNDADFAKIGGVASDLFNAGFGESADEVNASINTIVTSIKGAKEMSSEQLFAMGRDVLLLSKTFDYSAEEITAAGQSFINNGLGTWGEYTDLISNSFSTLGEAAKTDLIDTIKEYSGDIVSAGLNAQQTYGLLAAGVEAGFFDTDKLLDAVRESGKLARTMSEAVGGEYAKLGFDPAEVKKAAEEGGTAWYDMFIEIQNAIQDAGSSQTTFTELVGGQSEDLYNQFKQFNWEEAISAPSEAINSMGEITKTWEGDTAQSLESIKRNFDSAFQNAIIPILVALTPLLVTAAEWMTDNQELLTNIAGPVLLALVAGLVAVTFSMLGFNLALLANPLVWFGVAILGLGLLLTYLLFHWEETVALIIDVGNNIGNFFIGLGKMLGNFFIDYINSFIWQVNFVIDILNYLSQLATDIFNGITFGAFEMEAILTPTVGEIPHLATGGLITGPTVALIGEAGNEYVTGEQVTNDLIENTAKLAEDARNGNITNSSTDSLRIDKMEINVQELDGPKMLEFLANEVDRQTGR